MHRLGLGNNFRSRALLYQLGYDWLAARRYALGPRHLRWRFEECRKYVGLDLCSLRKVDCAYFCVEDSVDWAMITERVLSPVVLQQV